MGSVYTTVSVTVERYMAVCYPKSSKKYCTSRGSALSVLCVTCFSIIFNSTKFFELEVSSFAYATSKFPLIVFMNNKRLAK